MDSKFKKNCKATFRTSWYNEWTGVNNLLSPRWNVAKLDGFMFHRNHDLFKKYWIVTAQELVDLKVDGSSIECEGIKFLVDFAPKLSKLTLKNCSLRDLTDCSEYSNKEPVTFVRRPARENVIKVFHIDGIKAIEQCFMKYFIETMNALEEFSMTNCFIEKEGNVTGPTAHQYFDGFKPFLVTLLVKNSNTLKKLEFRGNAFQTQLFNILSLNDDLMNLRPTHLSLDLSTNVESESKEDDLTYLGQFVDKFCNKLENLDLQIFDSIEQNDFETFWNIITAKPTPLKTLNIILPENLSKIFVLPIEGFQSLETLIISDQKGLNGNMIHMIGGQRYLKYRFEEKKTFTPEDSAALMRTSMTRIEPSFLSRFPSTLKELSLNQYISETNCFVEFIETPSFTESFQKLTKLEINGPWIHSMHPVRTLLWSLLELETLTLSHCGLHDTTITGIDDQGVVNYLHDRLDNVYRENMDFLMTTQQLTENIQHDESYHAFQERIEHALPKLSNLQKLKHLDLSFNPWIEDLGIYYNLKFPQLETLYLNNCKRVTDIGLDLIRMNAAKLTILSVKNCRHMSRNGLNQLVRNSQNLQTVYVTKAISNRLKKETTICSSYNKVVVSSPCPGSVYKKPKIVA